MSTNEPETVMDTLVADLARGLGITEAQARAHLATAQRAPAPSAWATSRWSTVTIQVGGVPIECQDVVVSLNGDQLEIRATVIDP